jgi:hypothetical protein
MANEDSESTQMIEGKFGQGAYGPTVRLVLKSVAAAEQLRELFISARHAPEPILVTRQPGVRIDGVEELRLIQESGVGPHAHLRRTGQSERGQRLDWLASPAGWSILAGLVDPFVRGQSGHQYLTSEAHDDVLIEVSFGEESSAAGH